MNTAQGPISFTELFTFHFLDMYHLVNNGINFSDFKESIRGSNYLG